MESALVSAAATAQPLPVAAVIASATRRSLLQCDGDFLYWLEQRPQQRGRGVIVRWSASTGSCDLTPMSLSVRARVHEYGGGEFAVHNGRIVFCADPGQAVWIRQGDREPQPLPISPAMPGVAMRFADFCWHPSGDSFYAVRETHHGDSGRVDNELVAVTLDGVCVTVASGADFYAAPRVSPCGRQLAWLQWSNPLMPWDGTELVTATLSTPNQIRDRRLLAGSADESVLQPGFLRDGRLLAVSDRGQWWQLGTFDSGAHDNTERWLALTPSAAEAAVAPWSLGTRTWCETTGGLCVMLAQNGRQQLCLRAHGESEWQTLPLPVSCLAPTLAADTDHIYLLGAAPDGGERLLQYRLHDGAIRVIVPAPDWPDAVAVVPAEQRQVPRDGYAIPFNFYRPPVSVAPPLLVLCHSGPTGSASPALQAAIQFWTSRGFAVADVNYRGSDGFGRSWRQSLLGHWGEFDVADCVEVIAALIGDGSVDRDRVFLRGNSAGGLTVLQLLARHQGIRAAAVRYPVVDLPALAAVSHKFEAHYLQRLVGATDVADEVLVAASPNQRFARIRTPLLIQQGDQDTVVPVAQAEQLAAALQANHITHELVLYAGEGHGFRQSETLATALENEWRFFRQFC